MPELRTLVVGGAGFIGTHLTSRLAAAGHTVTVVDSLLPQVHGPNAEFSAALMSAARCIRADVRRPGALRNLLARHDLVYWLAAETGTGQSMYRVRRYADSNVGALATFLDLLVRDRGAVSRIVLTSSRAIYGEGAYHCPAHGQVVPEARLAHHPVLGWNPPCPFCGGPIAPLPTPEQSPPQPGSVYGWTKLAQEQLLHLLAGSTGLETVVLRLQNVYGVGQALRNPYTGVLMVFCNQALRGEPLVLYEDGEITRDFVHVDDVGEALGTAGTSPAASGGVFNIGSGSPVTIEQVAESIVTYSGRGSPVKVGGQFRVGDVRYALGDIRRAGQVLGYHPRVAFDDGIRRLLAWVQAEGTVPDRSAASARELAARGLLRSAPS
jgi:dTDP-L-rhamnose 4-epimerase